MMLTGYGEGIVCARCVRGTRSAGRDDTIGQLFHIARLRAVEPITLVSLWLIRGPKRLNAELSSQKESRIPRDTSAINRYGEKR